MVDLVGNFADLNTKNRSLRDKIHRGKWRKKTKPTPSAKSTNAPPKAGVSEPCYDSDKSDYYKPSNIIAKIQKEQEAEANNKKRKRGEAVENLPYYPSCWLSLGIITKASLDRVYNMSLGEQAYSRVYASMVDQGLMDSDNDPESENWVDPRSLDVCEKCGQPHIDDDKSCKLVLMQCYAEFDKPKRTFGCRKWFHIGCIGRKEVPDEDAWWACRECCMNLDLDGIRVTRTGLEFPPEDIDDGFDAAEAKKAAAKDSQPNKSDDEAVDIVDDVDDDSVDDEDAEDDGKATTKVDGCSKDDEVDSDGSFCPANSDVEDSYDGDTEDEDQTSSPRKKKRTGGQKRPAEVVEEAPVAAAKKKKTRDGNSQKRPAEDVVQEAPVPAAKKKKTGDVASSSVKARVTGEKPKTTNPLFDVILRKKLKACKPTMECLQHMSLPLTRSDEYEPPDDSDDESQSLVDQQGWPWMIHCLSCYTNVKPNEDGGKGKGIFKKPEYHVWAGSEAAAEKLREAFLPVKAFKIIVHTSFDDYFGAFRSESAMMKEAPPRPEPAPNAPKKKRPHAKKWKKPSKWAVPTVSGWLFGPAFYCVFELI